MADLEENFFKEMDEKSRSLAKPWMILIVVLILIFGSAVYGLIRSRDNLRRMDFAGWNLNTNLPNLSLGKRISTLSQTQISDYSFSVNSTELSAYLNLSDDNFPLKSTYTKIKPDVVVLYGRLRSSRFGLPVSITMKAEAKDGKLVLTPSPTELENVLLPTETQNLIASEISQRINLDINLSGKFQVGNINLNNDLMTINMILKP